MPAWVDTPAKEAAWKKAKSIVSEQRNKAQSEFTDKDWGLVTHIAQNMLTSAAVPKDRKTQVLLARVEILLEARRKRDKKSKDAKLPDDVRNMVQALSMVMAQGGQTIAALRSNQTTGMASEDAQALVEQLRKTANQVKDLLEKVNGSGDKPRNL